MRTVVSAQELVSNHRIDVLQSWGFYPKHYEELNTLDDMIAFNFLGEGNLVLRTVESGTIRLFHGWYSDDIITCEGVNLVIVNPSIPQYDHAYYAIVFGGEIQIGEKCLPKAACYHLMEFEGRLTAVQMKEEKNCKKFDFQMDERRPFKPISEL